MEHERQAQLEHKEKLSDYAFRAFDYIRDKLNWVPWGSGDSTRPGQKEILDAYTHSIKTQIEKREYDLGRLAKSQLTAYTPGELIQYLIRIPKGYNTGGTKIAAGIVNHFFDCFAPVTGYTFAPTWDQISGLLWKEIISDREGKGLPGTILAGDLVLKQAANHFIRGRATRNIKGRGQEVVQGQHSDYLIFVVDEAEGVEDFVFKSIDKMASNVGAGVIIIIVLANPRSRNSEFYRIRTKPYVKTMRLSCLWHPNVVTGKPLIPASVSRDWVDGYIENHTRTVIAHNEDKFTFEVPWMPGVILEPDSEFLYSVMGNTADDAVSDTVIPVGRYEAAVERGKKIGDSWTKPERTYVIGLSTQLYEDAWVGVDVARWGNDFGTIYVRWNGLLWRYRQIRQQRETVYFTRIVKLIRWLEKRGTKRIRVRVDTSGGYGNGIVEMLENDLDLMREYGPLANSQEAKWITIDEVAFGAMPTDRDRYADLVTQMYYEAAETLKGVAIIKPANELEADLTDRRIDWINNKGRSIRKLKDKTEFRKKHDRSPDDGDGAVLALSPDQVFGKLPAKRKARVGAVR